MSSRSEFKAPVFVGGTGRSGTTKTARLIAWHHSYAFAPIELGFHVGRGGLLELLNGEISLTAFSERMRTFWFARTRDGIPRGLQTFVERSALEAAIEALEDRFEADRLQACRELVRTVMKPFAEPPDSWVDSTPPNVKHADGLLKLFPDAGVVNVVRDGRDVACSVVKQTWGPNDPEALVGWWANEVRIAHEAAQRAGPDRVLTVRLEDLAIDAREETFERIFRFLGVEPDKTARKFFSRWILADRVGQGRWRSDVPREHHDSLNRHYATKLAELRAAGVPELPDGPS